MYALGEQHMGDHGVATMLPRTMRQPSGPFYHEPLDRNQALGDVVKQSKEAL